MPTFAGRAGITWTSTGSGTQGVHLLAMPLRTTMAGHSQATWTGQSLDRTVIETFAVGTGAHEFIGTVRYDDHPQSLLDLIQVGARNVTVTYYPDLADAGTSYACKLIAPRNTEDLITDPDPQRAEFGEGAITLRLRRINQTAFDPLYRSSRVLLRYRAGGSLDAMTFVRADTAHYVTNDGTLTSGASGKARIEWVDLDGDGFREAPGLLLEGARTNSMDTSENFAAWTAVSAPTLTSGQADPKGGSAAYLIEDDSAVNVEHVRRAVTFTGDAVKAVSVFAQQGTTNPAGGGFIQLRDTTASALRLSTGITWANGVPTVTTTIGTHLASERYRGNWYRFLFQSTAVTAANAHNLEVGPVATAAQTGNMYFFGVQCEDAPTPSSYNPTTGTTETRAADQLTVPFPAVPQAMTMYIRFTERGTVLAASADDLRLLHLGGGASGSDSFLLYKAATTSVYTVFYSNGYSSVTSVAAAAPTYNQRCEIAVTLSATGVVQLHQSLAGGTIASAAASAANPLPAAWAAPTLYLTPTYNVSFNPFVVVHDIVLVRGVHDLQACRRLAGVA